MKPTWFGSFYLRGFDHGCGAESRPKHLENASLWWLHLLSIETFEEAFRLTKIYIA